MYSVKYSGHISLDSHGHWKVPFNMKELSSKEFAQSLLFTEIPIFIENREFYMNDLYKEDVKGDLIRMKMFWFKDHTGVGISSDYWKGKIRYFTFGCNHSLKEKKLKPNTSYTCEKCNSVIDVSWTKDILEDTGWYPDNVTSRPSRGIRDYNREISFNHELSTQELSVVLDFLGRINCPGWTGVSSKLVSNNDDVFMYRFRTTYDSSD
jgi:hypothetical protein